MAITPIPGLALDRETPPSSAPVSNLDTEFKLLLQEYNKNQPTVQPENATPVPTLIPPTLQADLDRAALAYTSMQQIQRRLAHAYQEIQNLP